VLSRRSLDEGRKQLDLSLDRLTAGVLDSFEHEAPAQARLVRESLERRGRRSRVARRNQQPAGERFAYSAHVSGHDG
jgi:hypothetical protein